MQLGSLARLSARAARAPVRQQLRGAASHGPTGYGKGPYRGFSPPEPEPWKKACGTFFGTITFLWFFWRCKQDGRAFLVRRAPRPPHTPSLPPLACASSRLTSPARQPAGTHHHGAPARQGLEHPWDHHGDDHGHGGGHH